MSLKYANLFMQTAIDKSLSIPPDVYVHRITNRLRWLKHKEEIWYPSNTAKSLEEWLPQSKWASIYQLFKKLGENICT